MLPQRLRRRFARRRRNGVVQHDVAMLVSEGKIGGGQRRRARFDRGNQARARRRRRAARDGGIDARDPLRRDPAGHGDNPALELGKAWRLTPEIIQRLLESDAAGVDDEMVEMALMRARRPMAALPAGSRARPQALELIDAERAGFGCRCETGLSRLSRRFSEGHWEDQ